MNLFLPNSPAPTPDKINKTWRVLSALHPCLRTVLYTKSQDGRTYHRVLRRISNIHHGGDAVPTPLTETEQGLDD